eukprot:4944_1
MNSDREARKKALEAAKGRLAYRKKQKEQLQLLRDKKNSGGNTGFENKNDYGKKLVNDTKQLISDWTTTKQREEKEKEDEIKARLESDEKENDTLTREIVPGPRADLNIVHNVNPIDLIKKLRVEYVKEIQTDAVEIGQHSMIINEQTNNKELNEILSTFIENDINPYPSKIENIYKRIRIEEKKEDIDLEEKKKEDINLEKKEDIKELLVLSNDEATKLISSSTFLKSFRNKYKFLESALRKNEQHSIFIEANLNILGGIGNKQDNKMEKLVKLHEISLPYTNNRAITCLDYDYNFSDRFLASYSGINIGGAYPQDDNKTQQSMNMNEPDGLIIIYECKSINNEENDEYKLNKKLECQSMINCATFHPTKENIIIGASVSGQVLGWDIRLNKKTPTIRTEFSSSCHTQPIFALNFYNNIGLNEKIQQILTLSNDAKLCIWRDDMLYKPNNEYILKLNKTSTNSSTNDKQPKEITTTCLSYYNDNNNKLYFGSDEGCIYTCNLNLNKLNISSSSSNDDKELLITSYISQPYAHYGPITCINFHKKINIYLTSSFDWTVKLWHTQLNKPISIFNNMQDYIYDVKWSPTNPSIFAIGDGSGNLTIFDLNISFEHPVSEPTNILNKENEKKNVDQVSITKILWSPNGKKIIVGDSNGKISIFDCPVYDSVDNDLDRFEARIKRKLDSNDR